MKGDIIFLFLVGVSLGFIFSTFFTVISLDDHQQYLNKYPTWRRTIRSINKQIKHKPTAEVAEVKKIRILCYILTAPQNHRKKAVHIENTWGKHCDKLIFASTVTDVNFNAVGFNQTNDHGHLWGRVKKMLQFIYKNHINEYDWFFKGDDDTFMIPENMRYLLSSYSPDEPIYFGHKFNTSQHKYGYFSGGSGYVMSQKAVRIFVEKLLTNESLCLTQEMEGNEDWNMSICFDNGGVYAGDARDLIKRERFLPFPPEGHLFGHPDLTYWYWQRKYYPTDEGLDCCSNYAISYHYISPKYLYGMYFMVYKLYAYGHVHKDPLPLKKLPFTDIVNMLDKQRIDRAMNKPI